MRRQSIIVLAVVSLGMVNIASADMFFNDGGTHVVNYAIAGDVYVTHNTKLTLLAGSSIEKSLNVLGKEKHGSGFNGLTTLCTVESCNKDIQKMGLVFTKFQGEL